MSEQTNTILEITSLPMAVKNPWKDFDGSLFADPQKAGDADIDLVDQRQVLVALGVLDFVHSDGVDLSQNPVFQAPGDDVFDRVENLLPGSTKRFGSFFPGQPAGPAGQEQHVGSG
jgi:hypothetical protein